MKLSASVANEPIPICVLVPAAPSRSASARTSAAVPERATPPPAMTSGREAGGITTAGSSGADGAAAAELYSASRPSTSAGTSRCTGPGRPATATASASCTSAAASAGSSTRACHLTAPSNSRAWSASIVIPRIGVLDVSTSTASPFA